MEISEIFEISLPRIKIKDYLKMFLIRGSLLNYYNISPFSYYIVDRSFMWECHVIMEGCMIEKNKN